MGHFELNSHRISLLTFEVVNHLKKGIRSDPLKSKDACNLLFLVLCAKQRRKNHRSGEKIGKTSTSFGTVALLVRIKQQPQSKSAD